MISPRQVAGAYGDALAAIEEACLYGFSPESALWAAHDHLEGASQDEAVFIASILASWISTYLNPSDSQVDLPDWIEQASVVAARSWAR